MISILNQRITNLILITIVIISDQLSKQLIINNSKMLINKSLKIIQLTYTENYGAAFNIFDGNRIFLSLVSLLSSFILIFLIFVKRNLNNYDRIGLSLILGGTIGNGIDRICKGYVVDFIQLKFINFPIFNIADLAINIGFLLLLTSMFKYKKI